MNVVVSLFIKVGQDASSKCAPLRVKGVLRRVISCHRADSVYCLATLPGLSGTVYSDRGKISTFRH